MILFSFLSFDRKFYLTSLEARSQSFLCTIAQESYSLTYSLLCALAYFSFADKITDEMRLISAHSIRRAAESYMARTGETIDVPDHMRIQKILIDLSFLLS